ncbi:aldo/keto reductase [Paenarthrobacter aurescens]|jgi:aryl-alcohol dehydrogenase-like predicted oxidoreductase|uniref:Oxidoreductase, aldo/keto reductase family n=3 Tax=Micrococcaceae TaxID=1268 RepID=A1RA11_PAEAT|nr:oxidoreductase, aldo/keto reductase family [Paenarthrobacter aurescens TC1]
MPLTMSYGASHRGAAGPVIQAALDSGITHFDTADMYGSGANERIVGAALGRRRNEVTLATKVGIKSAAGIPYGVDGRPSYIRKAVERSLRRLRTDRIDLYYLHRVDPRVPIEDSVGALAELVHRGLVREVGVSEVNGSQLRRAHAVHPIAAAQMEWSLFERNLEADLLPVARELRISIVAYAPLGRGMLAASSSRPQQLAAFDIRRTLGRWQGESLSRHLAAMDELSGLAKSSGATTGQLALAWLLHQGLDVVPIPGTTKPAHVKENVAALDLSLDVALVRRVAEIAANAAR